MLSRGQIQSKVFMFILGLLVVSIILIFGYNSVQTANHKSDQAAYIRFTNKLSEDVGSVSYSKGSVKTEKYQLPLSFGEICFVDPERVDLAYLANYPIIKDSVESGVNSNVFLLKEDDFNTFHIDSMKLPEPYFYCFESGQTVTVRIEGAGDGAVIQPPPKEEWCKNAEDGDLCNGLDFLFGTGYKERCCLAWGRCCA